MRLKATPAIFRRTTLLAATLLSVSSLSLSGCALKDNFNTQAEAGRPNSAQVEVLSIPYDAAKPRYIVLVEPFQSSQSILTVAYGQGNSVPIGDQMAAQLVTALSKVGNFSVYDYNHKGGIKPKKGEKGPYVLKATLTEFNEAAEAEAESSGVSLGGIGAVAGIAGAVTGKPGLMWSGAGLAAANPGYEESATSRTGMVAFDLQIVERSSGRIVDSFEASGKFKAQSASNGVSLFGVSNAKSKFASSAIGQALRVAMNDAVQKASDALVK